MRSGFRLERIERGNERIDFKETEGGRGKVCKAIEDTIKKRRIDILTESIKNLMESMKWRVSKVL